MTADRSFENKVVVITGAAGGLGRALARRFGRAGARLALLDLDSPGLGELREERIAAGARCESWVCDVTDAESCRATMAGVADRLGGIDVLVNNAGITHRSPFAETDTAVIRRVMEVNFFGSLYCTKAAFTHLVARRGQIVVLSSVAGFAPLDGRTGYAASKHALHGFFDTLRSELRSSGVGVTMVCPSFIATGIGAAALAADGQLKKRPQATVGKVATPDEIAGAIVRATARRKRVLLPSLMARTVRVLNAVAPAVYERIMSRSVRREME